jgi:CHAD domain-containing protein
VTAAPSHQESLEREIKLAVELDFELPELPQGFAGVERRPEQHLRTVYFDTAEFRLWRSGITLRHRSGEEPGAGVWTLKLPAPSEGPVLDRTELVWRGSSGSLPEEAVSVLRGVTRSSPLRQIAELDTKRRRLMVADAAGVALGELDDDTVRVVGGGRDAMRFRQIELELAPGGDALVGPVLETLIRAGARQGGAQKLATAADLPPRSRPGVAARAGGSVVGDLVRLSLVAALDRLLESDYLLRIDPADPPVEGVHQARVATRRLRSELKLLRSALDRSWVRRIRGELKWLGGVLGGVRDDDVLAPLLEGDGDGSAFDADGRRDLRSMLDEQRRGHCRDLAAALASDRYLTLLDQLDEAGRHPPFDERRSAGGHRPPVAHRPAKAILPGLVGQRWRSLRTVIREAGRHPSDHDLHLMRIRAKELRYAAETAAPVLGKAARRMAAAAEAAQNVLGAHQDAACAELWLRNRAMEGTLAASYSSGRLGAEQARSRQALRRSWRSVWRKLDRKRLRRWLPGR